MYKMSRRGRKRKLAAEDKSVCEWEKNRIFSDSLRDEMETMWEIPQIYHFLQLTKEAFNISHLSMYEVERMLLMPKASKQLAHIMTCLLGSPSTTKSKLQKIPPMPYEFWTNILMYKLKSWFKMYQTKRQDSVKIFDTLGIEPEFWKIFPDPAEIEGKDFQDFSFRQRVWLLKTICDTAMHTRKTIQDEMAKQPWESQFETVLGIDRYGARYVYFPQFLHSDLRVYRHCLDNKILSTVKPPVKVEKPKVETEIKEEPKLAVPRVWHRRKRRRSRWSNGSLPPKKPMKKKESTASGTRSVADSESKCSSKASELSFECSSFAKSSGYETNDEAEAKAGEDIEVVVEYKGAEEKDEEDKSPNNRKSEEAIAIDELDKSTNVFEKTENLDSLVKENNFITTDDLSKSSKTDDEKLEEISSMNASKTQEKIESDVQLSLSLTKDASNLKSETSSTKDIPSLANGVSNLTNDTSILTNNTSDLAKDASSLTKDVNISKSDDEKLSESKNCDISTNNEDLNDEMSLDKWMSVVNKSVDSEADISDGSMTRRSLRIKHISEIKTEVEDAENLMEVCESDELSSIDLRDSLCRVSSPEIDEYNEYFHEHEWKVENFDELISDLSISNFQLVADSLDSLKDLTEYISSDKSIPTHESKECFVRPQCEVKLLKRMQVLLDSLENVESILKESTKKARNKLQREWNNFENGVTEEDQDQEGSQDGAANRWLIGTQGCNVEQLLVGSTEQQQQPQPCAEMLPGTAVSPVADENETRTPTDSAQAITATAQSVDTMDEVNVEATTASNEGDEAGEEERREDQGSEAKNTHEKNSEKEEEIEEPRQTRRVLRARGISSYTVQFYSDDESEEEKLDGWTDIEAIYAAPSSQTRSSSPDAASKTNLESPYESEEDSDQDWIMPSSRKRKGKRQSASRRLKTFQNKLQNIRADHNAQVAKEDSTQHSPTSPTKPYQTTPIKYFPIRQPNANRKQVAIRPKTKAGVATKPLTSLRAPQAPPLLDSGSIKTEIPDPNLHSVLDIKDEGPIYDSAAAGVANANVQSNYVVVTSGQAPAGNYYVMHQNPPVVPQSQFIQPATFMTPVSQVQPIQQVQTIPAEGGYYVQAANGPPNYIVQNPPRQAFIATTTPVVYQSQQAPQFVPAGSANYVQYVAAPVQPIQQLRGPVQPRIINTTTITPPRQLNVRARVPRVGVRMPGPMSQGVRPTFPHPPNGAVIRSAPLAPNALRPGQKINQTRNINVPRRQRIAPAGNIRPQQVNIVKKQKSSTSLIVLSDSDDEIEMIIPSNSTSKSPAKSAPAAKKVTLPPELMQRMSEGGISISPIKPAQPAQPTPAPAEPQQNNTSTTTTAGGSGTQLVVVVNETGSHYALALPNGSKLILTPEQVAQIRASNGGKLVL